MNQSQFEKAIGFELHFVPCLDEADMCASLESYDPFQRDADAELDEMNRDDDAPYCNCGQCSVGGEVTCVRRD